MAEHHTFENDFAAICFYVVLNEWHQDDFVINFTGESFWVGFYVSVDRQKTLVINSTAIPLPISITINENFIRSAFIFGLLYMILCWSCCKFRSLFKSMWLLYVTVPSVKKMGLLLCLLLCNCVRLIIPMTKTRWTKVGQKCWTKRQIWLFLVHFRLVCYNSCIVFSSDPI